MPRLTEAPMPPHKTIEEIRAELKLHEEDLRKELGLTQAALSALTPEPIKRGPGRPRVQVA